MRFTFNGDNYRLEFQRERKQIRSGWNKETESPIYKPSRYAYTTFTLLKDEKDALPGTVIRTYTTGCHHTDSYSKDMGRRAALTLALYDAPGGENNTGRLTKEFRTAVWKAYWNR